MSLETALTQGKSLEFVNKLEGYFKKLPDLPKVIVDIVVFLAPWLALIVGVTSVLSPLGAAPFVARLERQFGILAPLGQRAYFNLSGIFVVAMGILALVAFKPLLNKKAKGWIYVFWANILGVCGSVVGIITGFQGILGTVIGILIGMYVWFKVRGAYF